SIFDLSVFAIMIFILHAGEVAFRTGYFMESFLTQTVIVFAIRTRRVPFFRSVPSVALTATTLGVTLIGIALPFSPLAGVLGFTPPSTSFLAIISGLVVTYVLLVEVAKTFFYRNIARAALTPAVTTSPSASAYTR
ncbi:MAG TPA: cation transporting ATPase C-terminal domain-containing protein, partial [Candidatus Baltobacteraceae bacterium]|nr:cation transporting ATPase C-terminal domain-containing protein [Candidatus Baltobacteraceae bacterium]